MIRRLNLFFLLSSLLLFSSCQKRKSDKLIIATAANAQYAVKELATSFKDETGIDTDVIISSSGKHTAQIEAGAPYDIFISADTKYPESLYQKGFALDSPKVYAYGKLVIWTLSDTIKASLAQFSQPTISHIAMPNPKTAPYGRAAKQALDYYNLYEKISPKLVFGTSVAQTNQFILSGSAEIGITAASIVMAPAMANRGHWSLIDSASYQPIYQGAIILKDSQRPNEAKQFYNYLFTKKSQEVLEKYGYSTNHLNQ